MSFLALGSKYVWSHKNEKYKGPDNQLVQLTHSEIDWWPPTPPQVSGLTAAEQNLNPNYLNTHVNVLKGVGGFLLNFLLVPTSHYT